MGTSYEYTCLCGYSAEVSGGKDAGMEAVVETMTCHDCREIVDVPIGLFGKEGPTGVPVYDRELNKCPICTGPNITSWVGLAVCPKCGNDMTVGRRVTEWD